MVKLYLRSKITCSKAYNQWATESGFNPGLSHSKPHTFPAHSSCCPALTEHVVGPRAHQTEEGGAGSDAAGSTELGQTGCRPLTWAEQPVAGTLSPAFLAASLNPATKGAASTAAQVFFLLRLRHSAYQHKGHRIFAPALLCSCQ